MFHRRSLNNKINSIHERALRITYQDHISTFQELLNKNNSVSIHHRSLQALATEMFKIHRCLSPDIPREIFVPKISLYNLRRNNTFERRQVHSVYHGTESLSFLGPKIWDLVPLELKACVCYFLKTHYTSDLITLFTSVLTPTKSKLYVVMADASSTFTTSG